MAKTSKSGVPDDYTVKFHFHDRDRIEREIASAFPDPEFGGVALGPIDAAATPRGFKTGGFSSFVTVRASSKEAVSRALVAHFGKAVTLLP